MGTATSTYDLLCDSFKYCFPLMLLSIFPFSLLSGQSALSAYLTISDCGDLSSSSPINPEFIGAELMCLG